MRTIRADQFHAEVCMEQRSDVVVVWEATQCPACRDFAPVCNRVVHRTSHIKWLRIVVDFDEKDSLLADRADIRATPTLVRYRFGQAIFVHEGVMEERDLEAAVG